MSQPGDLADAAASLGLSPPAELLETLQIDLQAELESIRLFGDVLSTLHGLRNAGYKIALCSNLTEPYAGPVKTLLPFPLNAYAWSFEVGAVKPSDRIYQHLIDALNCKASEVLFVGDTPAADVEGPQAFGMSARLISRHPDEGPDRIERARERATVSWKTNELMQLLRGT